MLFPGGRVCYSNSCIGCFQLLNDTLECYHLSTLADVNQDRKSTMTGGFSWQKINKTTANCLTMSIREVLWAAAEKRHAKDYKYCTDPVVRE